MSLPPPLTPSRFAERVVDVLSDLRNPDVLDDDRREASDLLIHEATRVVLNWMGNGDMEALRGFRREIRQGLKRAGIPVSPIRDMPEVGRCAVKLLELVRVTDVFGRTTNAVTSLAMLRGLGSPERRRLMAWALQETAPFTAPQIRTWGFYDGERAQSAIEALNELANAGWLAKTVFEDRHSPVFEPTWRARRAFSTLDEFEGWKREANGGSRTYVPPTPVSIGGDLEEHLANYVVIGVSGDGAATTSPPVLDSL